MKARGNGEEMKKLVVHDPSFQDMDPDAARFIKDVTNIYVPFQKTERGTVNMCKAIQEIEQLGFDRGVSVKEAEKEKSDKFIAFKLLKMGMSAKQLKEVFPDYPETILLSWAKDWKSSQS